MPRTWWRRSPFWTVVSLVLMLLGGLFASLVQSDGGSVKVTPINWETPSGLSQSGLLFVPSNATAATPAPAVVVTHGIYNTKEFQSANYIELARRGYVVYAVDLYGHGESERPATAAALGKTNANGLYDGVLMVSELPYVDKKAIGVSGHSFGGMSANASVALDSARKTPLIASIYLQSADAIYQNPATGKYANLYGTRSVGISWSQYDEFFFRSYDAKGKALTTPRQFISTPNAQSFLDFGKDPSTSAGDRVANRFYSEDIDGKKVERIIYGFPSIHPYAYVTKASATGLVQFFEHTLPAPRPIAPTNQVWQWETLFSTLGLIGFGMFLVSFANTLVGTRVFAGLRRPALPAQPATRAGHLWLWIGLALSTVFAAVSYLVMYPLGSNGATQSQTTFIGLWAAANGVFTALLLIVGYLAHGRKAGKDLRAVGVKIAPRQLLKSLGLAAVVFASAMIVVSLVAYLFNVPFQLWVLMIKPVPLSSLPQGLLVFVLLAVYFVANSVAVNAFNRYTLGRREWLNTLVLAVFNVLPELILVVIQYVHFFVTGEMVSWIANLEGIWLFPFLVILPFVAVASRRIYLKTSNPYISGFITAGAAAVSAVVATLQLTTVVL